MAECAVQDCADPVKARGWCVKHYGRVRRNGNPLVVGLPRPTDPRPDGTKVCSACGEAKLLDDFYRRGDGRLRGRCKPCHGAVSYASLQRNAARRERQNRMTTMKRYGSTPEHFDALMAAQGGCCAICCWSPAEGSSRGLVVDHDHATGEIRGLLCMSCNTGLGMLRDDPELMHAAVEYLTAEPVYPAPGRVAEPLRVAKLPRAAEPVLSWWTVYLVDGSSLLMRADRASIVEALRDPDLVMETESGQLLRAAHVMRVEPK